MLSERLVRLLSRATLALTMTLVGCAEDPKPPPRAGVAPTHVAPTVAEPSTRPRVDEAADVRVDPRIQESCGLSRQAAHFEFDAASVRPDASRVLDSLVSCFTSGPLKGKAIRLVGHADPRGEVEYNFALGQRRAGSVGEYLRRRGVADRQLTTTSRGEVDASGSDERGWAEDRRVDVTLDD